MAGPAHVLRPVQARLKSLSNEGHFILEAERVSHPYLLLHCSGVTERCHMALPAHALHAAQCRLKSVRNEGQFTLEAETVFCLYRPPPPPPTLRQVTDIYHIALPAHALCAMQVRFKSVSNEGHLTLDAVTDFRSLSPLALQWGD
jgi:hypothetical protein